MLTQTLLPFKVAATQEVLTAQAGLALVGEFAQGIGLARAVAQAFPKPGGAGYAAGDYIFPLLLMLHGGGRSLEDLRQIRNDAGLLRLLNIAAVPSSDAVGDWLRRMGAGEGYAALGEVNRRVLHQALRREDQVGYTLDIDATQIVAEKQAAQVTYKGERGYMPILGHLAENGLVVGEEFREGNDAPGARNLEFIQHCVAQMPSGKRIAAVRADSAAYQASIINYCEAHKITFAIGADRDSAVKAVIRTIPESAWQAHREGEIAEVVHSMNKTRQAFRLIVLRRGRQGELFDANEPYRYTVIASNRGESAAQTFEWYCQRGECSENRLKELKIGFGMERLPCGQFAANAMFFRLGILAYNVFLRFKQSALSSEWQRHQVRTVRWRLYQTAGRIVRHARQLILKVRDEAVGLFQSIRTHTWECAHAVDT